MEGAEGYETGYPNAVHAIIEQKYGNIKPKIARQLIPHQGHGNVLESYSS